MNEIYQKIKLFNNEEKTIIGEILLFRNVILQQFKDLQSKPKSPKQLIMQLKAFKWFFGDLYLSIEEIEKKLENYTAFEFNNSSLEVCDLASVDHKSSLIEALNIIKKDQNFLKNHTERIKKVKITK